MKATLVSLLGLAMLSGTMAIAQTTEADQATDAAVSAPATVPFKAKLSGELASAAAERAVDGKAHFVFSIYSAATGGTKLFEEEQSIAPTGNHLYAEVGSATHGGIPAHILRQHSTIYLEVARASAPWNALASRQMIAFKPANNSNANSSGFAVSISVDPSVCFTCGGAWPFLVGSWSTPTPGAYERPSGCGGALASSGDTRPYLCSR